MSTIKVTGPDDRGLARVTLARPESRNALNLEMCRDLRHAFSTLGREDNTRAVVIDADGPVFCAGADLKERRGKSEDWVIKRRRAAFDAYAAIEACPVPVVACLDGPVVGSGGEIAMACDFALASPGGKFPLARDRLGVGRCDPAAAAPGGNLPRERTSVHGADTGRSGCV